MTIAHRTLLAICLAGTAAAALEAPLSRAQATALVQEAADRETRAQATDRLYRFTLRKETASGKAVRDMIETPAGMVARTRFWNDRELTAEERRKEDEKLARLVADPDEQRRKFKEQRDDQARVLRIISVLPRALLYTPAGTETMRGREAIRLTFVPNPDFAGGSRETVILRAARGTLWIDAAAKRIVKFDAVTYQDVNIGWGLLGHVNKKARIVVEQMPVGPGEWRLIALSLDATGRAFLFKTLNLRQRQTAENFREVSKMSLAQAVDLLRKGSG